MARKVNAQRSAGSVTVQQFIAEFAENEANVAPIVGNKLHAKVPDRRGGLCNQTFQSGIDVIGQIASYLGSLPPAVVRRFAAERGVQIQMS